jgi:type II secretory pathway pseudopilin PulG
MLTLILAMALMAIFSAIIVSDLKFEIKRDREEEMIHRGVQYSRAIRAFYRKFQRYPTKIEDLENTNNQRFLRKRYKDPLSCKNLKCADFKLLHFGEVQMTLSALGGASIPGANIPGANPAGTAGATAGNPTAGSDPSQPGAQASSGENSDATGANPSATGNGSAGSNQIASGQTIGGPIVGVASISKDPTIREFNHKKKYKDWVFIYDPAQEAQAPGRLIMTPYQPQLQGFGQQGTPNLNGQNGSSSGFGTGNALGSSPSGMQNSPTSPAPGGYGTPNPPSNPPQQ